MKTYVARQPIYGFGRKIEGYELLYRSAESPFRFTGEVDGDDATQMLISDAITAFGMDHLTGGQKAYVNFTRSLLLGDFATLLNPRDFVIEILEDTLVDQALLDCLAKKKSQGYCFALDDYVGNPSFDPLLPLVDIIKVDFIACTQQKRKSIAESMKKHGKILLAEKVETEEEYEEAMKEGYTLFQGYYFDKPVLFSAQLATVQHSTSMHLMQVSSKPDLQFEHLAEIIRMDVSLSFRLLQHVNTMHFYRGGEVNSIQSALVMMGLNEVRRWIALIFVRETYQDNLENSKTALVRGLFCERIAIQTGRKQDKEDAFMCGMFSMLDVIMQEDMTALLESLALSDQVRAVLLGEEGFLRDILNFVKQYERGYWEDVQHFIDHSKLDDERVTQAYVTCLQDADRLFA